MKTFKCFLVEAQRQKNKATYNDEHAVAHLWNHFTKDEKFQKHLAAGEHEDALKHMQSEVKKAKSDKEHPLHFSQASHSGFSGGRRTAQHSHSYHQQLSRAVRSTHALATSERRAGSSAKKGLPMRVTGEATSPVTKDWTKQTGKKSDAPKTDLEIYDPNNPKYSVRISKKRASDAQTLSSGPKESNATYRHAAKALGKEMRKRGQSKEEVNAMKSSVRSRISKVTRALARMSSSRATPERKQALKRAAHARLLALHAEHPELAAHVGTESKTGRGKYGRGRSAQLALVGNKVHNLAKENEETPPFIRASLGKGEGRPGVLRSSGRRVRLKTQG
jgi:hypothetical protein